MNLVSDTNERMIITKKELQGYLRYLESDKREFPLCVGQEFMIEVVKMALDGLES